MLDVYAIAAGTTLSSGFFLLPGLAAGTAGPALGLAYLVAAIPMIPAMLSIVELSTAMPRAGGVYYFLDRTMGPLFGTVGGLGTWLALVLKVSFALIGMGAYVKLYFPNLPMLPVCLGIALLLGVLHLFGAKKSGKLQVVLLIGLLIILAFFLVGGTPRMNMDYFKGYFDAGLDGIMSTAGLVYMSYIGVTKVASLSEEVKEPEKNLPLGIFLALGTALAVYVVGTSIMVGVVSAPGLDGDLTPVASVGEVLFGITGKIALSFAALFAFISVANAGALSASRYPLAMSRDHLLPDIFRRMNGKGSPVTAVIITTAMICAVLILFDPMRIAKLASAFQLMMFAMVCFAVIVMRESHIDSYDPGFRCPLYPWVQVFGIFASGLLIIEMGWVPLLFSSALVFLGFVWYWVYAKKRVNRGGAVFHVFERLGRMRHEGLDRELRGIMREKGLREEDPFDDVILLSDICDLDYSDFEKATREVSERVATQLPETPDKIFEQFMRGTRIGATPVSKHVALPHYRSMKIQNPILLIVRSRRGVRIPGAIGLTPGEEPVAHALFYLVSPANNPAQHLRILAEIAERVESDRFMKDWMATNDTNELKMLMLQGVTRKTLTIEEKSWTDCLAGLYMRQLYFPGVHVVALIRKGGGVVPPNPETLLQYGDRLVIDGADEAVQELRLNFEQSGEMGMV